MIRRSKLVIPASFAVPATVVQLQAQRKKLG
jgi:hypothetical protein